MTLLNSHGFLAGRCLRLSFLLLLLMGHSVQGLEVYMIPAIREKGKVNPGSEIVLRSPAVRQKQNDQLVCPREYRVNVNPFADGMEPAIDLPLLPSELPRKSRLGTASKG